MKKIIIGLCVIVVVAVFGGRALYLHKQSVREKDVVKIGALLPLSGQLSREGQKNVHALGLLAEKMNASRDVKVKFVFEDTKYAAKDSISAYRKLRSQGIDLFFVFGDLPGKAILPLAEEEKVPLFAMAESKVLNDSPVVVNISASHFDWTNGISDFVNETLKPQNVVIIYQKDVSRIEEIKALKNNFKDTVATIHEEQFDPGLLEVRSVVTKALNYNPDLVIVTGFGATYVAILNTLREQGFTGPIVSDVTASALRGQLVATPYPLYWVDTIFDDNTGIPEMEEFLAEFKEKFAERPTVFTMMGYVGAQAIINAIQTTEYQPMDILAKIQQTRNLKTVLGPLTIDHSKYMKLPIVIKQLQPDGSVKIVKE